MLIKKWMLNNSADDLIMSVRFDNEEIVVSNTETGEIVWQGKQRDWDKVSYKYIV